MAFSLGGLFGGASSKGGGGGIGGLVGGPTTYLLSKWLSPKIGPSVAGSKPKATTMPDPYANMSKVLPGLSGINAKVSADENALLSGQLSPGTVGAVQDYAARMGLSQGVPGSEFALYGGVRDIGRLAEQQVQQGLADYSDLTRSIYETQTLSPTLQSAIDTYNKQIAAAPNPVAAMQWAQENARVNQMANTVGDAFSSLGDSAAFLA